MPERIQLRRVKGWRMPPNTVNVARPGPWGNPFVVGKDGTREECVRLYMRLMAGGLLTLARNAPLLDQVAALDYAINHFDDLRGKNLACWCPKDGRPCHGDILLEAANRASDPPRVSVEE